MMAERCSNLVTKLLIERSRKGYTTYSPTIYQLDRADSPVIAERSARLASKKSFERIAQRSNDWSKNLAGATELLVEPTTRNTVTSSSTLASLAPSCRPKTLRMATLRLCVLFTISIKTATLCPAINPYARKAVSRTIAVKPL